MAYKFRRGHILHQKNLVGFPEAIRNLKEPKEMAPKERKFGGVFLPPPPSKIVLNNLVGIPSEPKPKVQKKCKLHSLPPPCFSQAFFPSAP